MIDAISQNINSAISQHDKAIAKAIKKAEKQSRDMDFTFERMFRLDDWRKKVFWGGMIGWIVAGVAAPIVVGWLAVSLWPVLRLMS